MSMISFYGDSPRDDFGIFSAIRTQLALRTAKRIMIVLPPGRHLVDVWDACLYEGRSPMIAQYPTAKLSKLYWAEEIKQTVQSVGIDLLICDTSERNPGVSCDVLTLDYISAKEQPNRDRPLPKEGTFLQMSSGTTGHRKGMEFRLSDVRTHAARFNEALGLTSQDKIVSWLPLYHDMGFIACFLMPRLLGVPTVMLDPMEWVQQPQLLAQAIAEVGGTVCYMPNFGFEVMSRKTLDLPSMRLWISCSEPTRLATMQKFQRAAGVPNAHLVNCWGMAENIFAVTFTPGIRVATFEGEEVVSAGKPIPGTEVKEVDGQLYVKSAYSITQYIGVSLELDAEGFYATGDVGRVVDGEIYLLGRKRDILNTGGRKRLLSDIDHHVGTVLSGSAGRIATLAIPDPSGSTDIPVILVEDANFWQRNRDPSPSREVTVATGLEAAQLHFVPPKFLTKTSSGKMNRGACVKNWKATNDRPKLTAAASREEMETRIRDIFPWLDFVEPIGQQIDSLGFVNLSLLVSNLGYEGQLRIEDSLDQVFGRLGQSSQTETRCIKIVSIGDAILMRGYAIDAIKSFAETSGLAVQFQHFCVPPAPFLLSDMIFYDYFLPRLDDAERFLGFSRVMKELKEASVILVDEAVHLGWMREHMVYPVLSRDFERDAEADLLGVRWAAYSEGHHLLPVKLVRSDFVSFESSCEAIKNLSDYLSVPVIRIAYGDAFAPHTSDWEVVGGGDAMAMALRGDSTGFDYPVVRAALRDALTEALDRMPLRRGEAHEVIAFGDQPHWCSWVIRKSHCDFILENFKNIVVHGKPASVPYLATQARGRGIQVSFQMDCSVPDNCDCIVQTGYWGKPETDKPVIQLMGAGWQPEPSMNLPPELQGELKNTSRDYEWAMHNEETSAR